MNYRTIQSLAVTAALIWSAIFSPSVLFAGSVHESVSKSVDQLYQELQKSDKPGELFGISVQSLTTNQTYAKWLEPSEYVKDVQKSELTDFNGSIAFARVKAPFFRVAQTMIAYDGEANYIPGIKSTRIIEKKRESNEKEFVLIEREREVPIALKPFIFSGSRYKVENSIARKDNLWVAVRVKLAAHGKKPEKSMMKMIEGFEFAKDLGQGEVLLISGGFALPNLGILKAKNDNPAAKLTAPLKAPLSKATFGLSDKVGEKLDVRNQIQKLIADSIVEGTFQTIASLIQVTTDERWSGKWAYQLTKNETKALLQDNKELLERAKKNNQISYKLK